VVVKDLVENLDYLVGDCCCNSVGIPKTAEAGAPKRLEPDPKDGTGIYLFYHTY